jgi:hypothetical protein
MNQERFVGIVVAFTTTAITLTVLAFFEREAASETNPPLPHSIYDRKLNRLDRQGVEAAYRSRVALLFQNWMTDTNQASQDRALRGHRNAREIFVKVMSGIDAREPPTEEDLK